MHRVKDFKKGLQHAADSISMIWQQKTLLLYLGVLAIASIFLLLVFYNALLFSVSSQHYPGILSNIANITERLISTPDWFRFLGKMAILFCTLFITTLFNVALVWHAKKILEKIPTTLLISIRASVAHYYMIGMWALISMAGILIQQKRTDLIESIEQLTTPLTLISILIAISWFLLTFFVMQVIVFEVHTNIFTIILRSGSLVRTLFFKVLGGQFWLGLIMILVITPPIVFANVYPRFVHFELGTMIVVLALKSILSTAQALFKTILYQEYISQKTHPHPSIKWK
ncbi:hypothetical protein KC460_03780 [Candidatus Dependentiae bacterium]|nr:hypothetical protein [Candidatus Dependentiae bacterium]